MSRSKLQLLSVLLLLPLGVGLCLLCLADRDREVSGSDREVSQGQAASRSRQATTAAAILSPPSSRGTEPLAASADPVDGAKADEADSVDEADEADEGEAGQVSDAPGSSAGAEPFAAGEDSLASAGSRLARGALIARVADRTLDERERLAAVIALVATPDGGYVPEVFRERFPDDPAGASTPGPIAELEVRRALTDALRNPEATVAERVLLVAALGPSQGYPEVASALELAFADPSPEVRGQVVVELAVSEEPDAGRLLLRAAEDPSAEVRVRAVLALGANPAQQPALEAAYHAEGQVREVKAAIVAQASEHAGTPQGAGFLTRVLREEPDSELRAEALASLAVAAEVDPEALRSAAGPELTGLLETARAEAGVSASADAERVLRVLRAG